MKPLNKYRTFMTNNMVYLMLPYIPILFISPIVVNIIFIPLLSFYGFTLLITKPNRKLMGIAFVSLLPLMIILNIAQSMTLVYIVYGCALAFMVFYLLPITIKLMISSRKLLKDIEASKAA